MKYLLDTDILADFFRGEPSVMTRIKSSSPSSIYVSMISRMEIDSLHASMGDQALKLVPVLNAFFSSVTLVPFGEKESAASAGLLASTRTFGHSLELREAILAGTALAHGLAVATADTSRFSNISGLLVENWRQ